jgi:hypothetical protein
LRRVLIIFAVLAAVLFGMAIWRGRSHPPIDAMWRAVLANRDMHRLRMQFEAGNIPLSIDWIDEEYALSARLAQAQFDASMSDEKRAWALDGHLLRMTDRAALVKRFRSEEWDRLAQLLRRAEEHVEQARRWQREMVGR